MAVDAQGNWIPIHLFRKKTRRTITRDVITKTMQEGMGSVAHQLSYQKLQATVQQYAKRANARLQGIEKAGLKESSNAYRWVQGMAYGTRKTMGSIKASYITEKIRFRTDKNRSYDDLFEELKRLDYFLFQSKTSSAAATQRINMKRAQASVDALRSENNETKNKLANILENEIMKDKNKLNAYGDWWRTSALAKLISMYGSEQGMQAYEKGFQDAKNADNTITKEFYDSKVIQYLHENPNSAEGDFTTSIAEYATMSITDEDRINADW